MTPFAKEVNFNRINRSIHARSTSVKAKYFVERPQKPGFRLTLTRKGKNFSVTH